MRSARAALIAASALALGLGVQAVGTDTRVVDLSARPSEAVDRKTPARPTASVDTQGPRQRFTRSRTPAWARRYYQPRSTGSHKQHRRKQLAARRRKG